MNPSNETNPLVALSDNLAAAVEKAGAATLLVDARDRFPASGVAYTADLVLTADHVVERDEEIKVGLPDGSRLSARLAGRDPGSDLALLRLERPVAAVAQASPTPARIGQLALALGRPSESGIQASLGVVATINGPVRTGRGGLLERYLRTDAIPYPGFSGGPLVAADGTVLGINTSGFTPGSSLTIPVDLAWSIADSLNLHGSVQRGYLGVRTQPVEIPESARQGLGRDQGVGLLVVGVETGSPASQAGLMVGDILVGIEGAAVEDADDLFTHLTGNAVGRALPVEVLRGGRLERISVTPAAWTAPEGEEQGGSWRGRWGRRGHHHGR